MVFVKLIWITEFNSRRFRHQSFNSRLIDSILVVDISTNGLFGCIFDIFRPPPLFWFMFVIVYCLFVCLLHLSNNSFDDSWKKRSSVRWITKEIYPVRPLRGTYDKKFLYVTISLWKRMQIFVVRCLSVNKYNVHSLSVRKISIHVEPPETRWCAYFRGEEPDMGRGPTLDL